jgi:hypothetical protein
VVVELGGKSIYCKRVLVHKKKLLVDNSAAGTSLERISLNSIK